MAPIRVSARERSAGWWRRIAPACLALLAVAAPLGAAGPDLVGDVVSMLEAGVAEEVILKWLPSVPGQVEELSAEDLIALEKAGASDALLLRLLELSRETEMTADEVPSRPGAPAAATMPREPGGQVGPESASKTALVEFEAEYSPRFEDPEPSWDLFLYLDGIPLTYLEPGNLLDSGGRRFTRELAVGRHVLRVTQERHEKRRGRWEHLSRIAPEVFEFELTPGPATVSVEFRQRLSDYDDPISFVMTQGARVIDSGRVGGDAERWAPVCEDVRASVPPGKEPSRSERGRLEECVEWSRIWPGLEVPTRQDLLEAMAQFDFRPVPKGS